MKEVWPWGRKGLPTADLPSALSPGTAGSRHLQQRTPGEAQSQSRNVSAPHSVWNNCLNACEEILSLEQLWGYNWRPAPLLPKIKQFILLFAISCRRKPWISSKTWQRCILGRDEERNWLFFSFFFFSFWATAGLFLAEEPCQRFQWLYPHSAAADAARAANLPARRCWQQRRVPWEPALCAQGELQTQVA